MQVLRQHAAAVEVYSIDEAFLSLDGMAPGQMEAHARLCLELVPDDEKQASLFRPVDLEREEKERRLMEAADKLNLWYGSGTVRTATAGTRHEWRMRRDRLSPCYTTRLADVLRATL